MQPNRMRSLCTVSQLGLGLGGVYLVSSIV